MTGSGVTNTPDLVERKAAVDACPFCGCQEIEWRGYLSNSLLRCTGCGTTSDDGSKERIAAKWNRRAAPPQHRKIRANPMPITKEWCLEMARREGDAEIGAGVPTAMDDARAMVLSPDNWPPMRVKRVAELLLYLGAAPPQTQGERDRGYNGSEAVVPSPPATKRTE